MIDCGGIARPLGSVLDDWQRADFTALDASWQRVLGVDNKARMRAWIERGRGHDKTGTIATMACWALMASPRRISIAVAAADKDQASLLRDDISRKCSLNPWLNSILDVGRERIVAPNTGSELTIISSDAPTSFGRVDDVVICDELSHWAKRDLWDSLFSTAAKKPNALLIVITNAGFMESWQWPLREAVRVDPAWIFRRLDGPQASWIPAETLAEQARLLPPSAYSRLWENQWQSGAGDALPADAIARALTLKAPPVGPEIGWRYCAGLDLGLRRDRSALVILGRHVGHVEQVAAPEVELTNLQRVLYDLGRYTPPDDQPQPIHHPGTGRTKLVSVQTWAGTSANPVSISEIEEAVVEASRRWNLSSVAADVWQAAQLAERCQRQGVPMQLIDPSGPNLKEQASQLLSIFNESKIDLYDSPLTRDLRAARVEERSYGFRVTSPRDEAGHGDTLSAFLLALQSSRRLDVSALASLPYRGGAPLIVWSGDDQESLDDVGTFS